MLYSITLQQEIIEFIKEMLRRNFMKLLTTILLILLSEVCLANVAMIKGIVRLSDREPASFAVVYIEELNKHCTTNENGKYHLKGIPYGDYTLHVSTIEAEDYKMQIKVNKADVIIPIVLKEKEAFNLSEITVVGKSRSAEIKSSGFAVGVVDVTKSKDQSTQVSDLLDRNAGVRLRQSGGMGSDVQYNINGLTGNSIRVFIDGIPVRNYGSSFSLSSIPNDMIERVEVYKGVVPGELAEDALGGAINIILKKRNQKSFYTSYSGGSFNTHRWEANGNYRAEKSGLTFRGSAFYNYSDNNYKVWGDQVYVTNPITSEVDYVKAKRFHDSYQSYGVNFDLGFTDVKWADVFTIGGIFSDMKKDIQHGATMAVVYGDRTSAQNTKMLNAKFEKRNVMKGLDISAFGSFSHGIRNVVDTCNYRYNWLGNIYKKSDGSYYTWSTTGEAGNATLAKNTEKMWASRENISYEFYPRNRISVHHLYNRFTRDIDDPLLSLTEQELTDTRYLTKNIVGATYETRQFDDKFKFSTFYKHYFQNARLIDPEKVDGVYVPVEHKAEISASGYGGTISYKFLKTLTIMFSGEKALRLPDETELLGNTTENVDASYDLKPEESLNLNLGAILGPYSISQHHFG